MRILNIEIRRIVFGLFVYFQRQSVAIQFFDILLLEILRFCGLSFKRIQRVVSVSDFRVGM